MEEDLEVINEIKRIESMLFILLGVEKSRDLIKLAWENVKEECINRPNAMEITTRLLIEDLIIYTIALNKEDGYKKILEVKEKTNLPITIKPYQEIKKVMKNI